MKLRIISDLHIDINKDYPLSYDDDVFTVICGDISGYAENTISWIARNIRHGVFVAGNHVAYSGKYTIQQSYQELERCFPLEEPVSFLKNSCKIVDDVVFVGGTLWTNFRLGFDLKPDSTEKQLDEAVAYARRNMDLARIGMNDYRRNRMTDGFMSPENTLFWHYDTRKYISDICDRYPDKKIVVVTHHAPSAKSLDSRYVSDALNPCYASDMDRFILQNKNIVLWCHGHIHQHKDYMIGTTRILCNPRGYIAWERNGEQNTDFDKNLIVEV